MKLQWLDGEFSVCQVKSLPDGLPVPFFFAKTDGERSLLCEKDAVPADALVRDDGWRGFRVAGSLDFSLIGILAGIADVLAAAKISIFAVSTFDTDYVFLKSESRGSAEAALLAAGYEF